MWLGYGSDVAWMWLGYGSGVARVWLGCGSDVFSVVAEKVWQKLRERGFRHAHIARYPPESSLSYDTLCHPLPSVATGQIWGGGYSAIPCDT